MIFGLVFIIEKRFIVLDGGKLMTICLDGYKGHVFYLQNPREDDQIQLV